MDARPNPINKILPCVKSMSIPLLFSGGELVVLNSFYGYKLDPDGDEVIVFSGIISQDFQLGSNLVVICYAAPTVTNDSGVDKVIRIIPYYSYVRGGFVVSNSLGGVPVLITIPNGEVANTIHAVGVLVVAGLAALDGFSFTLVRDADHADDTYPNDAFVGLPALGIYTAYNVPA